MKGADVRRIALSFPEAEEVETWGESTFRVRTKIFAILGADGTSTSIKASREQQAELLSATPGTYSFASYVGRFGWVAVRLSAADAAEVAELLEDAWRRTAPRALVTSWDER